MKLSRCQWYGDAIAPRASSSRSGVWCSAAAACSSALYSIEFLSGRTTQRDALLGDRRRHSPATSASTSVWR